MTVNTYIAAYAQYCSSTGCNSCCSSALNSTACIATSHIVPFQTLVLMPRGKAPHLLIGSAMRGPFPRMTSNSMPNAGRGVRMSLNMITPSGRNASHGCMESVIAISAVSDLILKGYLFEYLPGTRRNVRLRVLSQYIFIWYDFLQGSLIQGGYSINHLSVLQARSDF